MFEKRLHLAVALVLMCIIAACSSDDATTPANTPETVELTTFTPPAGDFSSIQAVTLDCPTADAAIYYTTDGTDPDETSTLFTPPATIDVGVTTTIKARGYKTGMTPSDIATSAYVIDLLDVAEPSIGPAGVIYQASTWIGISCSTAGAEIYYTTDGSEPSQGSTLYTTSLRVTSTITIRARAFATGMDPSPIAEETIAIIGGLEAHFPFNGNAFDASGNRHDGITNGPVLVDDRHGDDHSAYQFDGVDDFIELPNQDSFDFTEFTISAWIRFDTLPVVPGPGLPGVYALINKGVNIGNYTLSLYKFGGASFCNLNYSHRTAVGTWTAGLSATDINHSTWYHVAIRVDSEASFFVNGALDRTSVGMSAMVLNDDSVLIGKRLQPSDERHFNGFMDDVRFYNRALSDVEIQLIYDVEN